jgi:hypothetical protein
MNDWQFTVVSKAAQGFGARERDLEIIDPTLEKALSFHFAPMF